MEHRYFFINVLIPVTIVVITASIMGVCLSQEPTETPTETPQQIHQRVYDDAKRRLDAGERGVYPALEASAAYNKAMEHRELTVPRGIRFEASHLSDFKGNALGGTSRGDRMIIVWNVPTPTAPDEVQVLKALRDRLQFVQKSPQASNNRARALIAVMEALDSLTGTNEVSAPIGKSGFIDTPVPGSTGPKN